MPRQRFCYTLADAISNDERDVHQDEVEESANDRGLSLANPITNPVFNWTAYNSFNTEFLSHGRYNRMLSCEDYCLYNINESLNPFAANSNLLNSYLDLQSNVYGAYEAFCPPNYDLYGNAMGDPSDYTAANGFLRSQQRQSSNSSYYRQQGYQGLKDNGNGDGGFPVNPILRSLSIEEPKISESPFGTIFIVFPNLIRIDINAECNVYVTNHPGRCVGVLNQADDEDCIIHPNGKIFRDGNAIHMQTDNKSAKICSRGVVFTASTHALRYLVDASGTKSTSEKIMDLSWDFSFGTFHGSKKTNSGWPNTNACYNLIAESKFKNFNDGNKMWIVGGIRIKRDKFGEVSVAVNDGQFVLKTSATLHTMSISSPTTYMSVSCHPFQHFYVKRGSKIVSVGKKFMAVQNGSQRAGFDKSNRLVLH